MSVRAEIIQKIETYNYRELAFDLAESLAYSKFYKIGMKKPFKKSAFPKGIKAISKKILRTDEQNSHWL